MLLLLVHYTCKCYCIVIFCSLFRNVRSKVVVCYFQWSNHRTFLLSSLGLGTLILLLPLEGCDTHRMRLHTVVCNRIHNTRHLAPLLLPCAPCIIMYHLPSFKCCTVLIRIEIGRIVYSLYVCYNEITLFYGLSVLTTLYRLNHRLLIEVFILAIVIYNFFHKCYDV